MRETLKGNISVDFIASGSEPGDLAAIEAAEIGAATSLLGTKAGEALFEHEGFQSTVSTIQTPDYISNVTGSITGEITTGNGMLHFYWDPDTHPLWDLLTEGTSGWIVISPSGNAVGEDYVAYPVTVSLRRHDEDASNVASAYTVTLSLAAGTPGTFAADS